MKQVYLDNSATTKQSDGVTEAMLDAMNTFYGNPSSLHKLGFDAEQKVKKTRHLVGESLGITAERVFFNSGGTEGDNCVILGIANARRREGNTIITTSVEHPAVLESCRQLEAQGFRVIYLDVDENCMPNMKQLEAEMSDDVILISMMTVNNEVGTVMPIDEAIKMKRNAIFHTDGVQGYGKVDLSNFQGDFLTASGHKIHGPKGIGFVYGKDLKKLRPIIFGGGQEFGYRSGTENVPAIAGLGRAVEEMMSSREEYQTKVAVLRRQLEDGLSEIKDTVVNSSPDGVPHIFNISFLGTRGEVLLHTLEQDGIYVSTGSACSSKKKGHSHVLKAMGRDDATIEGAIRFSLSHYNTLTEIEYTVDKVKKAVEKFRRLGSFR